MTTAFPPKVERETYAAGECVFREGEFAMCAYIVESGKLEVQKDAVGGPIKVGTLGKGELFGEMALLGDTNRTATVTASEDTTLLVVNPMMLRNRLDNADPVVQRLVRVLIWRLREATKAHADEVGAARMG